MNGVPSRTDWLTRAAAALLVVGLGLVSAHRAAADPVPLPETGRPGDLVIAAEPRWIAFTDLSPGRVVDAAIDLRLVEKPWATTSFMIETDGAVITHPDGMVLEVRGCDTTWEGIVTGSHPIDASQPTCAGQMTQVMPPTPGREFVDGGGARNVTWDSGLVLADAPRHLLLSLALPAAGSTDETLMGITGNFAVRFVALGDENAPPPGGGPVPPAQPAGSGSGSPTDPGAAGADVLATTGFGVTGWALVAAGGIALGIIAARRREAE